MRTPETMVAAIHALQAAASEEVRAYFAVEPDGSFLLDMMMLEAIRLNVEDGRWRSVGDAHLVELRRAYGDRVLER